MYFIKTPKWLKILYRSYIWNIPTDEKALYLTFDDGPHAVATNFVLDELKKYNAKATFFCIGKNVVAEKATYQRILEEGNTVGNHTHNHLNGWKTKDREYIANILEAAQFIDSDLFRPPYGRITRFQAKAISDTHEYKANGFKVIMWDVLSGDFDNKLSPEDCLLNVINNSTNGSIIVFHDSEKAYMRMRYALPGILEHFSKKGFRFEALNSSLLNK